MTSDSEQAKADGNRYFTKKDYKSALECYTRAITLSNPTTLQTSMAIYYNNRATCHFQLEDYRKCLLDAQKSIELDPSYVKGYFRKASALFEQNNFQSADLVIKECKRKCEGRAQTEEFLSLEAKIHTCLQIPPSNTQEFVLNKDKWDTNLEQKNDEYKMMDFMSDMFNKKTKSKPSNEIPKFHLEYVKKYPMEKNHERALENMYFELKSLAMQTTMILIDEAHSMMLDTNYWLTRFGTNDFEVINNFRNRKFGEVIAEADNYKALKPKYSSNNLYHSFSNNFSLSPYKMNHGKTYISIGFTDLGIILKGEFNNYPEPKNKVNFYLYDCCPFVCIKSKVLLKMFEDPSTKPESIFQVWYSSGWSERTEEDFLRACNAIDKKDPDIDTIMNKILKAWIKSPVTLQKSRKIWFEVFPFSNANCCDLLEENDRVETARYIMTGELLESAVGSRTMFINPMKAYKKFANENFTFTQNLSGIELNDSKSFLSALIGHVLDQIKITQKKIQHLNVFVKRKEISPDDKTLLNEIKVLKPWVICWSNLSDYFPRGDFMKMAKFMSIDDTLHIGHSFNWVQSVWGVEISDYPLQIREKLIKEADSMFEIIAKTRLGMLIKLNPDFVTNIRNKAQYLLANSYYKNWLAFYLEGTKYGRFAAPLPHAFQQCHDILYFQFTFNKSMKMSFGFYENI